MSFLITDGAQSDKLGFMLTGDFVFVGDKPVVEAV